MNIHDGKEALQNIRQELLFDDINDDLLAGHPIASHHFLIALSIVETAIGHLNLAKLHLETESK